MASIKKITMREYNGTDYDTLYPKTIASQVDGVYNKTEIDTFLAGKAPAGYGLGVGAKILTSDDDLNNIWKPGYYAYQSSSMPKNAPDKQGMTADVFFLNVSGIYDNAFIQEVFPVSNGTGNTVVLNNKIVRSAYDVIKPWEWVNPPMLLSVEYRTTERYLGKPVYTMAVNFGSLPTANSYRNLSIKDVYPAFVIDCYGVSSEGAFIPNRNFNSANDKPLTMFLATKNNDNIYILCTTDSNDMSALTATVVVKYTKTTD